MDSIVNITPLFHLKVRLELQRGRPVGSTAAVQQGLHWQLLAAGAVDPLAALLAHSNPVRDCFLAGKVKRDSPGC